DRKSRRAGGSGRRGRPERLRRGHGTLPDPDRLRPAPQGQGRGRLRDDHARHGRAGGARPGDRRCVGHLLRHQGPRRPESQRGPRVRRLPGDRTPAAPVHVGAPVGARPQDRRRQPRLPALRAPDLAHRGPGRHDLLDGHRAGDRPGGRLLPRMGRHGPVVHHRPVPLVPVPAGHAGPRADPHLERRQRPRQAGPRPVHRAHLDPRHLRLDGARPPHQGPGPLPARARVHPGGRGHRGADAADPLQGAPAQHGRADRRRDLAGAPRLRGRRGAVVVPRSRPHRHAVARQDACRRGALLQGLRPVSLDAGCDHRNPDAGPEPARGLHPGRVRPQDSSM
ncbi:MAG: Dipeptide transport system permease protein DppC, partial [uncultured Nocardioidaceae bacterium]